MGSWQVDTKQWLGISFLRDRISYDLLLVRTIAVQISYSITKEEKWLFYLMEYFTQIYEPFKNEIKLVIFGFFATVQIWKGFFSKKNGLLTKNLKKIETRYLQSTEKYYSDQNVRLLMYKDWHFNSTDSLVQSISGTAVFSSYKLNFPNSSNCLSSKCITRRETMSFNFLQK